MKSHRPDFSDGPRGPLRKWDVSKVVDMSYVFSDTQFDGDISKWDVSRVVNMKGMFSKASSFAQTLCGAWSDSTADKAGMFDGSSGRICTTSMSAATASTTATITSNSKTTSMQPLAQTLSNLNRGPNVGQQCTQLSRANIRARYDYSLIATHPQLCALVLTLI